MTANRLRHAATLAVLVVLALFLRIVPSYPHVFTDGRIVFPEHDPWIHMRQIDNLLHHFPVPSLFDPYRLAPDGQRVAEAPLFDLLVALPAWALGLGTPSPALADTVAAFVPPILGALVVVAVYVLALALFGRWEALFAGALVAILPGTFLTRSRLGYTDHHVAEVLFLTLTMLFAALALRAARDAGAITAETRGRPDRTRRYAILAGAALGCYLLTWSRGVLLVLILLLWAGVQLALDYAHRRDSAPVLRVLTIVFALGLVLSLPFQLLSSSGGLTVVLLVAGAGAVFALERIGSGMRARHLGTPAYVLLLGVLALGAAALATALVPSLAGELGGLAARFRGLGPRTVGEATPFVHARGGLPFVTLWEHFTTCSVLALVGLGLLTREAAREDAAEKTLVVVWSVVMLAATLAQIRFAYYLAINVALLAAFFAVRLVWSQLPRAVAAVLVVAVLLLPNAPRALRSSRQPLTRPDSDWIEVLEWMRDKTPEPFGDPAYYYARYPLPETAPPIRAAYGVMTWWDYGYWITRLARRVPVANPTQSGAAEAAAFYTATDEATANGIMDARRARYVLTDASLTALLQTGALPKFEALALWAGKDPAEFFDVYLERDPAGAPRAAPFFHPEYYRTMAVRLHLFGGLAVEPQGGTWVIGWKPPAEPASALALKELTFSREFPNYEIAEAFLARQEPGRFRIACRDPAASCVPLEALTSYTLVHRSPGTLSSPGGTIIPSISVFEYRAGDGANRS